MNRTVSVFILDWTFAAGHLVLSAFGIAKSENNSVIKPINDTKQDRPVHNTTSDNCTQDLCGYWLTKS